MNPAEDNQHLESVCRHIRKVQENCTLLGERLIANSEVELGRTLIANGYIHDNSKLYGIEWRGLRVDVDEKLLAIAVDHHNRTNPHHPEYWNGIQNMPRIYLAEAVCDWAARSSEFGSSLIEWVEGPALKRFGFKKRSRVHTEIKYFVNLLLDPAFTPLPKK